MTIGEIVLMKPHESPRINKKSIRGDSRDSWPVWNRDISATSRPTRPFGEVGGKSPLQRSSRKHFAKIKDKKVIAKN